jgi:mRNA-degrading endonuclease YafQ of YafQ-DinJ toxin-antitoxin module
MIMKYVLTDRFKKKYGVKEKSSQDSIDETIRKLIANTKYPGLHCHKIRGIRGKSIFEAYINDEARLTYEYGNDAIIFRTNCHHDVVLRNP